MNRAGQIRGARPIAVRRGGVANVHRHHETNISGYDMQHIWLSTVRQTCCLMATKRYLSGVYWESGNANAARLRKADGVQCLGQ
jgi:hypothetical protein